MWQNPWAVNGMLEPASGGPVLMMHVDHEPMAMPDPPVPVRMAVRLRALPALVLMLMMLVVAVEVLVPQRLTACTLTK